MALSKRVLALACASSLAFQGLAGRDGPPKSYLNTTDGEMKMAVGRGGPGRRPDFWYGLDEDFHSNVASLSGIQNLAQKMGYEYFATSTVYADTPTSSCGSMDTHELVKGTGYHAVASAQAMQNLFQGHGCCWCGKAGPFTGKSTGTAPMGCMNCAKGRFVPKRPYPGGVYTPHEFFAKEHHIIVADICPHQGNEVWCPERAGTGNTFHAHNHFDWAHPPHGFDNFFFAFTPTPCSPEITAKAARMSKC